MGIKVVYGNITTAPRGTVICHQVNCKGVMGAGVAGAIARKWPQTKQDYCTFVKKYHGDLGGKIVESYDEGNYHIVHMFAQDDYGHQGRFTNYEWFYLCLCKIRQLIILDTPLAFPYGIGCGLGGGNWSIIKTMIEEVLSVYEVKFYKYG